jgi:hypothetical protein
MSASVQHTLTGLFALTAILALLALAGNGAARAEPLPSAADTREQPTESATAADPASEAAQHRAQRRAVRAQLSMPYFSYSRALPRTAEI